LAYCTLTTARLHAFTSANARKASKQLSVATLIEARARSPSEHGCQEATHAVASNETTEEVITVNTNANPASATTTQEDDSMENIGALIQDLFHSDNAKVNAALDVLEPDIGGEGKRCEYIHAAGGCLALVLLLNKCLKYDCKIPACDRVTELNEAVNWKRLTNRFT
jgi:hypothetical protein